MELLLKRCPPSLVSLQGELFRDGEHQCYTIERAPTDREHQPIPAGRYPVTRYLSPTHHQEVLLLHDVPGRSCIEIHIGNWATDTKGCIAVGKERGQDAVWQSGTAFHALLQAFTEPCWITVEDAVPPDPPRSPSGGATG